MLTDPDFSYLGARRVAIGPALGASVSLTECAFPLTLRDSGVPIICADHPNLNPLAFGIWDRFRRTFPSGYH